MTATSDARQPVPPLVRFLCTKATPWNEAIKGPVRHDDVHEVGEQEDGWPGGDIVTYECRNCGHRWKEELPQ